jgi:hypothetical protein
MYPRNLETSGDLLPPGLYCAGLRWQCLRRLNAAPARGKRWVAASRRRAPTKPPRAHAARSGRQRSSRSAPAGGAATIGAGWGVVVPSIIRVWVGRRQAMRRRTEFHLGTGSARRSIG